jgi:tetratricopeptide (TPR) repeat protein
MKTIFYLPPMPVFKRFLAFFFSSLTTALAAALPIIRSLAGSQGRTAALLAASSLVLTSACSKLTSVENPTITDQVFLRSPAAMQSWIQGCERQAAITADLILLASEVVSDNYFNNRTLFNRSFDIPRFIASDVDIASIAQNIARLRTMAEYGINTVAAADKSTTNADLAELYFYKALALSYAADYFVALPAEALGKPLTADENYAQALLALGEARKLSANATTSNAVKAAYSLLSARIHYHRGNKTEAISNAETALTLSPAIPVNPTSGSANTGGTRFLGYDPVPANGAFSSMQIALYTGQDEFQPLPRLDFLDPKYFRRSATQESPACILKTEEALLILAEAEAANGNTNAARVRLEALLQLVRSRLFESVNEQAEERGRRGGTVTYPLSDSVLVFNAGETSPILVPTFLPTGASLSASASLASTVRTRGSGSAPVVVPTLSGTSLTQTRIDAVRTAERPVEALLELIYLTRQEIFLAEGRRMVDLGMKFPLPELETLNNVQASSYLASAPSPAREFLSTGQIPSFIPPNSAMNAFTFDVQAKRIVIAHNMNRVIVQNRTSPYVAPFH